MLEMATTALTFAEAAKLLPKRNGQHVSIQTIRRWALRGVRGVRLSAFVQGGVYFTTPAALEKFQQECTTSSGVEYIPTSQEMEREAKLARESMARKGLYGRKASGSKQND